VKRARLFLSLPSVLAIAGLLLSACGGGDAATADPGTCGPATSRIGSIQRSGQRSFPAPPERVIEPGKTYVATLQTDKGEITIDLAATDAPITVNNFVFLACNGYYDGLTFHRYEPGFVIQGGDPRGDGSGGPGYIFANEVSANLRHNAAGVVAMANAGANTNGSQFYITLNPAPALDGDYNVFGRVRNGMDNVRDLRVGSRILSVSIEEK
jgi:cyclophilin family peptidyl-prolyl cis-trans isomerase